MKENELIKNLKSAIETTKAKIIYNVNTELLKLYMYIGDKFKKTSTPIKEKAIIKSARLVQFLMS